ncbi:MAG: hypothetical protein ACRDBP_07205, partial [Luteolibacter sp.]
MKPAFLLAILVCLIGCSHRPAAPDLRTIYNAAARQSHVDRNPIIVIPGILGSKLVDSDDGRIVWGRFGSGAIDHGSVEGMRSLALPVSTSGWPRDGVKPAGVLSELEIAWGLNFR